MKTVLYVVTAVSVANKVVSMSIHRIVQRILRPGRQSTAEVPPQFNLLVWGCVPLRVNAPRMRIFSKETAL